MTKSIWSWICVGALAAAAPLVSLAQEDPAPQQRAVVRSLRLAAEKLQEAQAQAVEAAPTGEYWIGIGLGELADIVKEQLGLEHGLVVDDVLADSPAQKAGFQKNDILVKVGDKALAEPMDLVKAVEEAKESELSISLLRGGKETTIKVTPAKRPDQEFEARVIELPKTVVPGQLQEEIKRLEDVLKALKEKGGGEGAGIVFARPGTVLTPQRLEVFTKRVEFPKDLSISVTKEGDQPAEIHVKKGDKEWDVTEDKMGELPDDVRPHVHRFFGGLWGPGLKELADKSRVGGPKSAPYYPVPPTTAPVPPLPASPVAPPAEAPRTARAYAYRLESRGSDDKFDEIMKELKALRKEVDELRGKSSEEKK